MNLEDVPGWTWVSGIVVAVLGYYSTRGSTKATSEAASGDRTQAAQQTLLDQLMARVDQLERALTSRDAEVTRARQELDECNRDRHELREMIERVEGELRAMKTMFIGYKPLEGA